MCEIIKTGIEGLDAILNGGIIYEDSVVVIIRGRRGVFKTILGMQAMLGIQKSSEENHPQSEFPIRFYSLNKSDITLKRMLYGMVVSREVENIKKGRKNNLRSYLKGVGGGYAAFEEDIRQQLLVFDSNTDRFLRGEENSQITIDYDKFSKLLLQKVDENYGQLPEYDEKIILEHTSANPNGPLHIGHIRNSIFGDSLARLLKLAGRDVETQYYVNDMGRQIAIIVCGITECGLKIEDYEGEKLDHKIGKLYYDANKAVEEDENLANKVDELIQKYEEGEDEELNAIFEQVVSSCLSGMKETLQRININHDDFVWEGQFIRSGEVDDLVKYIQREGFTREDDVLYIDLTDFNIEKEFVLRRSNGTSLYSTRDLAYHKYKATLGDTVLDILGSDHKLAAKQIKVIFEEIFRQTPPEVIFYEFITLPEGSMSTRRGKFVSVDDLIDEAVKRATDEIKSRNPDLTDDEIAPMAEDIGIGAVRFFIAKLSPEKHLTFKWDEALSFERGCASIQYAHARACKFKSLNSHRWLKIVPTKRGFTISHNTHRIWQAHSTSSTKQNR